MRVIPTEIWHKIFMLACTDDGYTGRSLSLVSTKFHDVSAPFKYQSLVITHWSRIVAFSQMFCQLPDHQKKIKYLFVHNPYILHAAEGNSRLSDASRIREEGQSEEEDDDDEYDDERSWATVSSFGEGQSEENDDDHEQSDDEFEDDLEGYLDSREVKELSKDAVYLCAVRDGLLPRDGNTRDDVHRDAELQAFFNNILQAFRAILNETSSTLTILAVHWTSFTSMQMQELLPPLPRLEELHINCSFTASPTTLTILHQDPPTTVFFPRLQFLYILGLNQHNVANIAPELTHIRLSMHHLK